MENDKFDLELLDIHWLQIIVDGIMVNDDSDSDFDLCAHGHVRIKIGDEIIENKDVTVSAGAFMLLKSLIENHDAKSKVEYQGDQNSVQLIPCCGNTFYSYDKDDKFDVSNFRCQYHNTDWSVEHLGNDKVRLKTVNDTSIVISEDVYREKVFAFADKVEDFFKNNPPRRFSDSNDDYEKRGYELFWKNWHEMRNQEF